jgi:hypothetical protein
VLAAADGRPYARTTYRDAVQTPETYWNDLGPLRERGRRFRAALIRAEALKGRPRAAELVTGLSEVDPRFIHRSYAISWSKADRSCRAGVVAGALGGRRAGRALTSPRPMQGRLGRLNMPIRAWQLTMLRPLWRVVGAP